MGVVKNKLKHEWNVKYGMYAKLAKLHWTDIHSDTSVLLAAALSRLSCRNSYHRSPRHSNASALLLIAETYDCSENSVMGLYICPFNY